jgi:glycosyltransferase involved in cell wall biosynthesis
MPVYNSEEFLRDTINDILHQTYKDFELICIDDGSTDNSLKILMDFAKNDNRIIIFHKKKENAGQARNSGFKFAKGEYVIFLDADDRFESTLLEKMYNQINKMSSDICVCNADKFKDDTSEFINSNLLLSTRIPRKTVFNHKNLKANLYLFCTPCPWNKIFKKSFLKKNHIQFQNLPRANDLFFTYYALTKAKKITTINEKLVHYRIGTENSLQSTTDKTPFSSTKALLRLKNQLNKDGLFSGYIKQSFTNMAINNCIYNLKSLKDKTGKKVVLYWLKNTGLEELEITGNPKEYYLYDNTKKMEEIQKLINIYIH